MNDALGLACCLGVPVLVFLGTMIHFWPKKPSAPPPVRPPPKPKEIVDELRRQTQETIKLIEESPMTDEEKQVALRRANELFAERFFDNFL